MKNYVKIYLPTAAEIAPTLARLEAQRRAEREKAARLAAAILATFGGRV